MIAQALGEYTTVSILMEGLRDIGSYLQEVGRDWGLMGVLIVVGATVVWSMLTRVR